MSRYRERRDGHKVVLTVFCHKLFCTTAGVAGVEGDGMGGVEVVVVGNDGVWKVSGEQGWSRMMWG